MESHGQDSKGSRDKESEAANGIGGGQPKQAQDYHDTLYEMLVQRDEVTWHTIIHELVKSEQLDPWNIDISLLSQRFLETIKKMQEMNFFISGKVLLASALLLKMKSDKLVHGYMADFDAMLFPPEEGMLEDGQQEQQFVQDMYQQIFLSVLNQELFFPLKVLCLKYKNIFQSSKAV